MRLFANAALALVACSGAAVAQDWEDHWSGTGWYVIPYDEGGWLKLLRGPYTDFDHCWLESERAQTTYLRFSDERDREYECVYLTEAPNPDPDYPIYIIMPRSAVFEY